MSLYSFFLQHRWVIIFYTTIILLIYINRKKFEFQGKIVALYKTKFGLNLMDYIAKKYPRLVKSFGIVSIYAGYLGFVIVILLLFKILYDLIAKPDIIAISPVIPGIPIAGTNLVFPLVTGWISLLIIIVVHEFSHGVVARAYNIKILSSGFAFFGPILGAFVEPDEKHVKKQKGVVQNSVYAAGPFSNVVLAIVALLLLNFVVAPLAVGASNPIGIEINPQADFPAQAAGLEEGDVILAINDVSTRNLDAFFNSTRSIKPGDTILVETKRGVFEFETTKNPDNESRGYMGITITGISREGNGGLSTLAFPILKWLWSLLFWVFFISINIGLFNLFPIFITDGARMLKVTIDRYVKNTKKAQDAWFRFNQICLILLLSIVFIQIYNALF